VTHEPLPHPGDIIDAWPWYGEGDPRSVGISKVAPIRGWTVVAVTEDEIQLDEGAIPRASAWRRAR